MKSSIRFRDSKVVRLTIFVSMFQFTLEEKNLPKLISRKIWFTWKWLTCHTVYVWVSKSWQYWLYISCWCLSQQWQIFWRPFIFIFFRHLPPDVNEKREPWLYPSLGLSLTAFEKLCKLLGFSRKKSIKGRTLKKQKVTRHTHSNILNWTQPQVSRESTEEKKEYSSPKINSRSVRIMSLF